MEGVEKGPVMAGSGKIAAEPQQKTGTLFLTQGGAEVIWSRMQRAQAVNRAQSSKTSRKWTETQTGAQRTEQDDDMGIDREGAGS